MAKNIIAGIVGILATGAIVWAIEMIGHAVYPPPDNLNFADANAMQAYIAALPVAALLFIAAAWFAGTLGGIIVACRVGTAQNKIFAGLIAGLMLLATAYNLAVIPHPLWFSVVGIAAILMAAWLALKLSPDATRAAAE